MMRVSLNLVQFEGLPGSPWQFFNGAAQDNTVNCSTEVKILFLNLAFERWRVSRYRLIERKNCWGLRRNFISTVFTAIRYSQVEKAEPPRNELRLRNTWMKASCVRSSASATSFVIRRHTEYTSLLCNWQSVAKPCSAPRDPR